MSNTKITQFFVKCERNLTNQEKNSNDPCVDDIAPVISVFCDGSCISGKFAGYGVVFPDYPEHNICESLTGKPTNNRAEFMAFIRALEVLDVIDSAKRRKAHVYTDSELLVNTVTKWMYTWKQNGWKRYDKQPVKNLDLVQKIMDMVGKRVTIVQHVRAHTNRSDWASIHNAQADSLAKKGALMQNTQGGFNNHQRNHRGGNEI